MGYTVYKHTCPNGKVYIGATKRLPRERWGRGYGYHTQIIFYEDILKYGWDNIDHEIIAKDLTEEDAHELEIELIALYDSTNPEKGYNISTGGRGGGAGVPFSEERRQQIGEIHRGKKLSEDTKRKLSETHKGKSPSEEHRRKISAKLKEIKHLVGTHPSEEAREKMRQAKLGKSFRKGMKHTEESKRKMSESQKGNTSRSKEVICLDTGEIYPSASKASNSLGISPNLISRVCRGDRMTTHGLRFAYTEDLKGRICEDGKEENV